MTKHSEQTEGTVDAVGAIRVPTHPFDAQIEIQVPPLAAVLDVLRRKVVDPGCRDVVVYFARTANRIWRRAALDDPKAPNIPELSPGHLYMGAKWVSMRDEAFARENFSAGVLVTWTRMGLPCSVGVAS